MKIGKGHELIRINPIHVDNWTEEYVENKELVKWNWWRILEVKLSWKK